MQCRFWIGTSYRLDFSLPQDLQYGVYQKEMCPSTSRIHCQFFVVFSQRKRLDQVKKIFPGDHVEPSRHPVEARAYCMKEATRVEGPFEIGSLGPWAKKAKDVNIPKEMAGKRVREYMEEHPDMWRSIRTLRELRSEVAPRREALTQGILFTGRTGTGKTKLSSLISQFVGFDETYWKPAGKWWNGYDQEKLVIYDEFRGQTEVSELLKLLDRTPHQVEYKGGVTQFNSRLVIFCSNLPLGQMYFCDMPTLEAIKRRFLVVNFL